VLGDYLAGEFRALPWQNGLLTNPRGPPHLANRWQEEKQQLMGFAKAKSA
jgi:hypothetical protein